MSAYEDMLQSIKEQEERDKYKKEKRLYEKKPKALRRYEYYERMGERLNSENRDQ